GVQTCALPIYIQQRMITGTVVDENGVPLAGTSISEKGTANGTKTNSAGDFSLNVQGMEATLVVSYVGYMPQEIPLSSETNLRITLLADASHLNEVVVIGYGTQRKKEITGAVASVRAEDFNTGNITNPAQLLQGKVAGLSITNPGSNPNAGYTIRLRGLSTFGANTGPLIVVDGVPGVSLLTIDPSDIESM